jgi:hypothetical protein
MDSPLSKLIYRIAEMVRTPEEQALAKIDLSSEDNGLENYIINEGIMLERQNKSNTHHITSN